MEEKIEERKQDIEKNGNKYWQKFYTKFPPKIITNQNYTKEKISFIYNYWNSGNKKYNVPIIMERLSKYENAEFFWNNDSSSEKEMFNEIMKNKKGGVFYNKDIGELRGYNLGLKKCTGDYIIISQEDIIPPDYDWVSEVLNIFKKYPKVGMIGLKDGCTYLYMRTQNQMKGKANFYTKIHYSGEISLGPWIIKREVYEKVGLLDECYLHPNHPYIGNGLGVDADYAVRSWLNGYHVIHYHTDFPFLDGYPSRSGKMESNTGKCSQGIGNSMNIYMKKYKKNAEKINKLIDTLNKKDFSDQNVDPG